MSSINTVAELAQVSTATVSRVLNNSNTVRPETRARVEAAIVKLGYRANAFGRSLRTAESRLLLVLVPDFSNPYYTEVVRGIEGVARQHDYNVLLCETNIDWAREKAYLQLLHNKLSDGVICLDPITIQRLLVEEVRGLPWVACSEFLPESEVPYVSIDHRQAAEDAVKYLLQRGHRRIALVNSDETYLYAQQRRAGYEVAMSQAGLPLQPEYMLAMGGVGFHLGERAAETLIALDQPPSAVFAVSDTLAIGVIKGLRRAHIRVPQDMAVMGFDNIPISGVFEPALSTVAQPMQQLGETAIRLLLERMAGGNPASQILRHELILRDSA